MARLWIRLALYCVLAAGLVTSARAQGNGFVGIYADAGGTVPCASVPPGTGTVLYVVATIAGTTADGIIGAEFRVEVSDPSGWYLSFAPVAGTAGFGNVLDTNPGSSSDGSGWTMAFPTCQPGAGARVLLGTIGAFNASGGPTTLTVKRHSTPTNANYSCPLFVLCNSPAFTKSCMSTGSGPSCTLGKGAATTSTLDPAVFIAGLNVEPLGGGEGTADPLPMPEDVLGRYPVFAHSPAEPDRIGVDGSSKSVAGTASDTMWVANWSFDAGPGACNFSGAGWTAEDNLVRNDSPVYWRINSLHAHQNPIFNKAAELAVENCWSRTGYGNAWDQAVKLRYKGTGSTLEFDFLSEGEVIGGVGIDYMSVEPDSAGASNARVSYQLFGPQRRPEFFRTALYTERFFPQHAFHVGPIQLPTFGQSGVEHIVWIRFHSDKRASDEDGGWDSAYDAALVVDNVRIAGGDTSYNYFEDFEDGVFDPLIYVNSDRSKPLAAGAPSGWGRAHSHVTDNDKCIENTTCSLLFTDPTQIATGDLAFGPNQSAIRPWLDNVVVSPWVPWGVSSQNLGVLAFDEFPGNRYPTTRIARAWDVRGMYTANGTTCVTAWSHEGSAQGKGSWELLTGFNWTPRVYDISQFAPPVWSHIQVRLRVADDRGLYGNPHETGPMGPGPYIDRVRIGRVSGGPVLTPGVDTRTQAQDCFAGFQNAISPGEHFSPSVDRFGTCAFSIGGDLGVPDDGLAGSANLITGDSIAVAFYDRSGDGINRVAFYYRVIAGPHAGKMVPLAPGYGSQTPVTNGFFKQDITLSTPFFGTGLNLIDFDDTYFRGGDVLQYFWYVQTPSGSGVSYPPGIVGTQNPDAVLGQIELLTGGLLEVNFLPQIDWSPAYLARVAAHATGDIDPTPQEIAASSQRNCILYVNKVNTARRSGSANRTSFMHTLDRLGYAGHYDVYDVQGFGNTNNDLASRASLSQLSSYALIVHDVGRSEVATIPDGSNRNTHKLNQAEQYQQYLNNAPTSLAGAATLWIIGENWAFENQANALVGSTMRVSNVVSDQAVALNPVAVGQGTFTFANGTMRSFGGLPFSLKGGCPAARGYDGSALVSSGDVLSTHRYGGVGPSAMVLAKDPSFGWNTVAMMFNWFDVHDASGQAPYAAREALAGAILGGVLPVDCQEDPNPTDVPNEGVARQLPMMTALHPNVPNPFNPATDIRFDLAKEGLVVIRVFDVSGRLVKTLLSEYRPREAHVVRWDGLNDAGSPVATGLYICRMESEGVVASRKLVVLR